MKIEGISPKLDMTGTGHQAYMVFVENPDEEFARSDVTKMTRFVLGDVHGVSAVYERTKLFYPCDPDKNVNCRKTGCYINGGECWQTSEKAYRRDDA